MSGMIGTDNLIWLDSAKTEALVKATWLLLAETKGVHVTPISEASKQLSQCDAASTDVICVDSASAADTVSE